MANSDRPNGFRPIKTVSGAPWTNLVRTVGAGDDDMFVGDVLTLSSGLAVQAAAEGAVLGVAVGFGKKNAMSQTPSGAFGDPDDAGTDRWFDTSANTNTEWVVYYVPSQDVIFEGQTSAADTLVVGEALDILATDGDQTTGMSKMEIAGSTKTNDGDVIVVEIPDLVDNDHTLAWGRYWVMFVNRSFAAAIA